MQTGVQGPKKGAHAHKIRFFFFQYLKEYPTGHEVLIEGFSRTVQMTRKKENIEVRKNNIK